MKYFITLLFLFVTQVFAFDADHRIPPTEPHYWMKQYPGAEPAKVSRCLADAQAVFYKQLKGDMNGVAWATLHQGNAWEKCMEAKG